MADPVLDRVAFQIAGDIGPYRASMAQAEAQTQRTAALIKKTMGSSFNDFISNAEAAASKGKKALGDIEAATTKTHGSVATATREFRALFDELSSGRTRQTPGTLAIIATRVFGISGAALAAGAAILSIPVAIAAAALMAEDKLAKIQLMLKATGDAAGVSANQITAMGDALAKVPGNKTSSVDARSGIGVLASHGNIPGSLLAGAGQAAINMSHVTGQGMDKVAPELERILADPAKGAQTLYDQFKLLDQAQVAEVERLDAVGDTYGAQQRLIEIMNDKWADAADAAGFFARTMRGIGGGLADWWNGFGRAVLVSANTDQQELDRLKAQRKTIAANPAYEKILKDAGTLQPIDAQITALTAKVAASNALAAARGAQVQQDQQIKAGLAAAGQFDVTGVDARERAANIATLTTGLAAANAEAKRLAGSSTATAAQIKAAKDNAAQLGTALRNAQNPNYRPGSGIPKGRSTRGADNAAATAAAEAQAALDEAIAIGSAPEGDRAFLKAKYEANLAYLRETTKDQNPAHQADYAAKRDAAIRLAAVNETNAASDLVTHANEQTEAQKRLAAAYAQGSSQVAYATAYNEAYAAHLKNSRVNVDALTKALLDQARATALVSAEQFKLTNQMNLAASKRIGAAGGNPAGIAAANNQNTAISQLAPSLATAQNGQDVVKYILDLADAEKTLNDQTAQDRSNSGLTQAQQLGQENAMLQLQIRLKYADAELRAKEIADLETRQQLIQEGYTEGTAEYQAEYDRLVKLKEAQAEYNLVLGNATKQGQLMDTFRSGLENMAVAGAHGFGSLKQAAASFFDELGTLILRLYILGPLLNGLMGPQGGGTGGLFGSILSSVFHIPIGTGGTGGGAVSVDPGFVGIPFGGPRAAGGPIDPSKYYMVGENGPEWFAPGVAGSVLPNVSGGGSAQAVHFSYDITVGGNGDKELMQRMQGIAASTVQHGLGQYDKQLNRTIRGKLVQADKRAWI